MPQWLKNLTMLVVLLTWSIVVGFTLHQGKLPDAAVLGIPAAVVLALAPPIAIGRRNQDGGNADQPADGEAT